MIWFFLTGLVQGSDEFSQWKAMVPQVGKLVSDWWHTRVKERCLRWHILAEKRMYLCPYPQTGRKCFLSCCLTREPKASWTGVFPRYQSPCKHVQSCPTESHLMLSRFHPRRTGPRCSSASPLRTPVQTLFLPCLRYKLEYTAHKMQLWPVSFKTTGTDTFVNYNTDTRTLGQGVETCLYPFLNSPKSDTQRLGNYGSLYYLLLSIKTMLLFFCYLTTPNKTCSSILQI